MNLRKLLLSVFLLIGFSSSVLADKINYNTSGIPPSGTTDNAHFTWINPAWDATKILTLQANSSGNAAAIQQQNNGGFTSWVFFDQLAAPEEVGAIFHPNINYASCTGSTVGTALTLTACANGIPQIGSQVSGGAIPLGVWIIATGGEGSFPKTYTLNKSAGTVSSTSITTRLGQIAIGSTNLLADPDTALAGFGMRTEYRTGGTLQFNNFLGVDAVTGRLNLQQNGTCNGTNRFGLQMDLQGYIGACSPGPVVGLGFEMFGAPIVSHGTDLSGCPGTNGADCKLGMFVAIGTTTTIPCYELAMIGIRKNNTCIKNASGTPGAAGYLPKRVSVIDIDETNAEISYSSSDTIHTLAAIGPLKAGIVAVASLPTCNAAGEGYRMGVNNALAPTALATVVGGGTVHVPVYCDGTNWIVD
jgi:hypothetical protein